jgi:hypothetical protein
VKKLGANVVRVQLQVARFMDAADRPHQASLVQLEKLVGLAEDLGLYLDVTGLGSFRAADVPAWYSGLTEAARWRAQATFWEAVAGRCAGRPGVFAYNLMNEPIVSGSKRAAGEWSHPAELDGLRYVEFLNLEPAGRRSPEIAARWIHQMVEAIRRHDQRHLVTVGLMLVDMHAGKPEEATGLVPSKIAGDLDFLSVHLYPEKGQPDLALETLRRYRTGKPLLVEETYPLRCGVAELQSFLERSRGIAQGWLGFYWGQTPEELRGASAPADQRTLRWLELFQAVDPNRAR